MSKPGGHRKSNVLVQRASFPHWATDPVRYSDTDALGHVNNVAFVAFCESGRAHFFRPAISRDPKRTIPFVVARLAVDYLGEAHWPSNIDIGTGVLSLGRTSCTVGQGLFVGERCIATAETVIVTIDGASRAPCPLPAWLREYCSTFVIAAQK